MVLVPELSLRTSDDGLEPDQAVPEPEVDASGGPVPLLGQDDLGPIARVGTTRVVLVPLGLGVIEVVSVDEHHSVGVLLNAASVPEVGKLGPVSGVALPLGGSAGNRESRGPPARPPGPSRNVRFR